MLPRFMGSARMMSSFIKATESGGSAVIQFNRPKALNAINQEMFR